MRAVAVGVLFAWLFLGTWCTLAGADGGSIRLSGKKSGYQITVFTAPTPFRAGPVDISVLVQDSLTGEPMASARVTVRMSKAGQLPLEYPATPAAATNKLFRAAQFELPEPGHWDMQVKVEGSHGPAVIAGAVEAAEPLPRWREIWPWIGWPALAIALFSIHQILKRPGRGKASMRLDGRADSSVATRVSSRSGTIEAARWAFKSSHSLPAPLSHGVLS
ncbi:MAG TPA: hypothetical protein VKF17_10305 [Isosphaeraceae bacterium]|nr:hypothetical protein [Isosphaeraceae bacterium]